MRNREQERGREDEDGRWKKICLLFNFPIGSCVLVLSVIFLYTHRLAEGQLRLMHQTYTNVTKMEIHKLTVWWYG